MGVSWDFCCQCLCPHGEPEPTNASAVDPPMLQSRFGSVSCGVTALLSSGFFKNSIFVIALKNVSLFLLLLLAPTLRVMFRRGRKTWEQKRKLGFSKLIFSTLAIKELS